MVNVVLMCLLGISLIFNALLFWHRVLVYERQKRSGKRMSNAMHHAYAARTNIDFIVRNIDEEKKDVIHQGPYT